MMSKQTEILEYEKSENLDYFETAEAIETEVELEKEKTQSVTSILSPSYIIYASSNLTLFPSKSNNAAPPPISST